MRILITNDDGIHAPGLEVCEKIARALSDEVWIVAPETDQSGVAHSLSLNDPLRLREVGPRHFAVKGTPTDCVIMGARHIMKADARSGAVRRQPRAQLRRGRRLIPAPSPAPWRAPCSAFPSFALSQAMHCDHQAPLLGDGDQIRARSHPPRARGRHAARRR